jgi:hypothetical protein
MGMSKILYIEELKKLASAKDIEFLIALVKGGGEIPEFPEEE